MRLSKNNKLSAVIFDLDGVILDSMPAHAASWKDAFSEVGVHLDMDVFFRYEGNLDWDLLRDDKNFRSLDREPGIFEKIMSRQRQIYLDRYAAGVSVYPDAYGILTDLKEADLALALVTSSTRQVLAPGVLDLFDRYFNHVVTGDQVEKGKPHPDPYLKALENLGIASDRAIVVENAPAGIESARKAGLTCIALTTTLPEELLTSADLVLPDHEALKAWLADRLNGNK